MSRWIRVILLPLLWPGAAVADSFPDLTEFAHCLPGGSWTQPPARVELGYVRPYDLPQLHGSHLRVHQRLLLGLGLDAGLEWLEAGPVEHRRPQLGLRWQGAALAVGVLWSWQRVEVQGHPPSRRARTRAHIRWRWGALRVAGRWQPRSTDPRPLPSPAELVLGLSRAPWKLALRRRPSPWRDGSLWEGGLLAGVAEGARLGLRLGSEDASLHVVWIQAGRRFRLALTLDGPRARGLALAVEWGR